MLKRRYITLEHSDVRIDKRAASRCAACAACGLFGEVEQRCSRCTHRYCGFCTRQGALPRCERCHTRVCGTCISWQQCGGCERHYCERCADALEFECADCDARCCASLECRDQMEHCGDGEVRCGVCALEQDSSN